MTAHFHGGPKDGMKMPVNGAVFYLKFADSTYQLRGTDALTKNTRKPAASTLHYIYVPTKEDFKRSLRAAAESL